MPEKAKMAAAETALKEGILIFGWWWWGISWLVVGLVLVKSVL